MISKEVRHLIETGSAIRRMWADGLRLKEKHGAANVADMTLGNPVAEPPAALLEALREVVANPPPGLHRYTPHAGHPEVRARVAAHLSAGGILPGAGPEHVTMTAGAGAALNVALRAVLDPGDEVILLSPYFPDYPAHVANHRGTVVPVPTDGSFLPDVDAIERSLGPRSRVLIMNHPNNPTGREYPVALVRDVVEVLRARGRKNGRPVWLLSDEPYREIRFRDDPFTSPASLYEHGILCYSFSKCHSIPGERIGYLALNPDCPGAAGAADAFSLANRILGFTNAPALWQHVVSRCLDARVDLSGLRRHRDRLLAALRDGSFDVAEPEGTFYLFPRTPGGNDREFVERLMQNLLLVVPGGTFGRPGHFRIAFCTDDRTVDLAVERLAEISRKDDHVKKDERTEQILEHASRVFFEKGFDRASIRDIARESEMSLAGLYYHFDSKEDLLFRIQERVYSDLLAGARARLAGEDEPVARLEAFIHNHLSYFLANLTDMTVLSHEYRRLEGEAYRELSALRREYYGVALDLVAGIEEAGEASARITVLGLFGMLNWLYTWYRPGLDPGPDELAAELSKLYLYGLLSPAPAGAD